jgi:hypothetical protein
VRQREFNRLQNAAANDMTPEEAKESILRHTEKLEAAASFNHYFSSKKMFSVRVPLTETEIPFYRPAIAVNEASSPVKKIRDELAAALTGEDSEKRDDAFTVAKLGLTNLHKDYAKREASAYKSTKTMAGIMVAASVGALAVGLAPYVIPMAVGAWLFEGFRAKGWDRERSAVEKAVAQLDGIEKKVEPAMDALDAWKNGPKVGPEGPQFNAPDPNQPGASNDGPGNGPQTQQQQQQQQQAGPNQPGASGRRGGGNNNEGGSQGGPASSGGSNGGPQQGQGGRSFGTSEQIQQAKDKWDAFKAQKQARAHEADLIEHQSNKHGTEQADAHSKVRYNDQDAAEVKGFEAGDRFSIKNKSKDAPQRETHNTAADSAMLTKISTQGAPAQAQAFDPKKTLVGYKVETPHHEAAAPKTDAHAREAAILSRQAESMSHHAATPKFGENAFDLSEHFTLKSKPPVAHHTPAPHAPVRSRPVVTHHTIHH